MDGIIIGGLIAGGISLGINGVGWAITLVNQAKKDATVAGAIKQKLEDICTDVDKVDKKVDKVDDKISSHIMNHPGRSRK